MYAMPGHVALKPGIHKATAVILVTVSVCTAIQTAIAVVVWSLGQSPAVQMIIRCST